ncbi:MAG: hypothetical protein R3C26_06345 [Calditrichia bacterium]
MQRVISHRKPTRTSGKWSTPKVVDSASLSISDKPIASIKIDHLRRFLTRSETAPGEKFTDCDI